MKRKKYKRKYKKKYKSFNQKLGSSLYSIIFLLILFVLFKIWGMSIFNDINFILIYIISFISVKIILRSLGIWKY